MLDLIYLPPPNLILEQSQTLVVFSMISYKVQLSYKYLIKEKIVLFLFFVYYRISIFNNSSMTLVGFPCLVATLRKVVVTH